MKIFRWILQILGCSRSNCWFFHINWTNFFKYKKWTSIKWLPRLAIRSTQFFSTLLFEIKNAKSEIFTISDNSSNMAAIGLKICTKQSYGKFLRILDTRSHLGWGPFLHGNPARPFIFKCFFLIAFYQISENGAILINHGSFFQGKVSLQHERFQFLKIIIF